MSSEDNQVPETYFKLAKYRNVPKMTSILEFTDYYSDVQTAVSKLFHNATERKWLLETEMVYWLEVVMENTKREYWTMQFVLRTVTRFIDLVLKLRLLNEMSLSTNNPPNRVNFLAVIPAIEQKLRGLTTEGRVVKRNSTNSAVVKRVRFAPIAGKKKTPLAVPVFLEKAPVLTTETVRPLTDPIVPPAEPIVTPAEPIVPPAKPFVPPSESALPHTEPTVPVPEQTLSKFEPTVPFSDPALPPLEPTVFPIQSAVSPPVSGMRGLRPSTPQVKQMIGLAPTVPKHKENEVTFKLKEVKKKKKKFTKFLSLATIDEDPIVVTESESLVDSIVFAMQNSNEFVELKLKKPPQKVVEESDFFDFLPVPETFENLIDIDATPTKSEINNNFGEDASDESATSTPRLIDNIGGTPPGTAVPAHNPMFSWDFVPNEVDSNDKCNGKQEINQEFVPLKPSTSEPVKFSLPKIDHSTPLKAPNANSSKHSSSVGRNLFRALNTSPNSELIMEGSPEAHMKNTSQERKSPVRISPFTTEFGFSNMVVTPTRDDDRLLEVPTDRTVPQQNVCNNDLTPTTSSNTPGNSPSSAKIDWTDVVPISSNSVDNGNPLSFVSAPTKLDGDVDQLPICAAVLNDLVTQLEDVYDLNMKTTATSHTPDKNTSFSGIDSTNLIATSSNSVNTGNPSSLVLASTELDDKVDQLPVCASIVNDLLIQWEDFDLVSTTTPNTPVNSTSSAGIDSTYLIPISSSTVNTGNPSSLVCVSTELGGEVDQLPICASVLNELVTQLENLQDLDLVSTTTPNTPVNSSSSAEIDSTHLIPVSSSSVNAGNPSSLVSAPTKVDGKVDQLPVCASVLDDLISQLKNLHSFDLVSTTTPNTPVNSPSSAEIDSTCSIPISSSSVNSGNPSSFVCVSTEPDGEVDQLPICSSVLNDLVTQLEDSQDLDGCDAASPSVDVVALDANSLQSDNFSELVSETARIENIVHFPFEISFDDDLLSVTAKLTSSERLARLKKNYYEWLYDKDTQKQKSGPSVSHCWKKMDYGEERFMSWWCRTNLHPTMTQAVDHKEAAVFPSVDVVALIDDTSRQSETARIENIVHFPFEIAFDDDAFDDLFSVTAKLTSSERLARHKNKYYEWLYDQERKSDPSVSYLWEKMDYGEQRFMPWWYRTILHPEMTAFVDYKKVKTNGLKDDSLDEYEDALDDHSMIDFVTASTELDSEVDQLPICTSVSNDLVTQLEHDLDGCDAASPSVEVVALVDTNSSQSDTTRIENTVHFPFEIAFDDLLSVTAKLRRSERMARLRKKYYEWLYDEDARKQKSDPLASYFWEKKPYGKVRFMPWWYRTSLHPEMTPVVDHKKVDTDGLKKDSLDEYEDDRDDLPMIDGMNIAVAAVRNPDMESISENNNNEQYCYGSCLDSQPEVAPVAGNKKTENDLKECSKNGVMDEHEHDLPDTDGSNVAVAVIEKPSLFAVVLDVFNLGYSFVLKQFSNFPIDVISESDLSHEAEKTLPITVNNPKIKSSPEKINNRQWWYQRLDDESEIAPVDDPEDDPMEDSMDDFFYDFMDALDDLPELDETNINVTVIEEPSLMLFVFNALKLVFLYILSGLSIFPVDVMEEADFLHKEDRNLSDNRGSIPLSEKRTCTLRRCPADHYHTRTLGPAFKKRLVPWQ